MKKGLAVASIAVLVMSCASGRGWQLHDANGSSYRFKPAAVDLATLEQEARSSRTARVEDLGNITKISVPARRRILLFTQETHPAHPAVIIMHVSDEPITRAGGFVGGDRAAFDAWLNATAQSRDQLFATFRGGT